MSSIKKAGEKIGSLLDSSKPEFRALRGGKSDGMTIDDIAEKHGISVDEVKAQLAKGIKIEYEHTHLRQVAQRISMDHLSEIPDYYDRLIAMEREAGIKESRHGGIAQLPHPEDIGQKEYVAIYEAMHFGYNIDEMARMALEINKMIPMNSLTKYKVLSAIPAFDQSCGVECLMVANMVRESIKSANDNPAEAARNTCMEIVENVKWIKSKTR